MTAGADDPPAQGDAPPGLQRERTLLAWTRTLLALVVVSALLVRVVGPPLARPAHLPAAGGMGVALWLFVATDVRYRRAPARVTAPAHLGLLTAATVVVGAVAIGALLTR